MNTFTGYFVQNLFYLVRMNFYRLTTDYFSVWYYTNWN